MDNIISNAVYYMVCKNYHFPEGWVEACLQWLFEEYGENTSNCSQDKWCELIEQQWLFTDLRDLETSSSLNFSETVEMRIFNGEICLQIMNYEDLSKSFYAQREQQCRGDNSDDIMVAVDEEGNNKRETARRSLQLHLTDGVNACRGFEFEPWRNVKLESLSCGCKCRLRGPFMTRRGMAFLKEENIDILGGEVEELKTVNRFSILDDLLQKNRMKLKVGQTNTYKTPISKRSKIKTEIKPEAVSQTKININPMNPVVSKQPHFNHADKITSLTISKINRNSPEKDEKIPLISPKISTQETCIDFEDDDDELMNAFEEISEVSFQENKKVVGKKEEVEENRFNESSFIDNKKSAMSKEKVEEISEFQFQKSNNKIDYYNFEEMSVNSFQKDKNYPIKSEDNNNKEPITCLIDIFNELNQLDSSVIESKQYRVKAMIVNFLSKLSTVPDNDSRYRWNLQLRISDGTSSLDCQLNDDFMTSKIGFTANDFHEMKMRNDVVQLKISIGDFQKKMVKSNCGIYTLRLSDVLEKIEIVDFEEIDEAGVTDLKEKVSRLL